MPKTLAAPAPDPAVYTREDIARLLKWQILAVDRARVRGALPPGFKVGNSRRWLRSEIDAWLAEGCPPVLEFMARRKTDLAASH
jgi:hypothetical protein